MNYRVSLTPAADRDLDAAADWIAKRSPAGAAQWFNGLIDAIKSLATMPGAASLPSPPSCLSPCENCSIARRAASPACCISSSTTKYACSAFAGQGKSCCRRMTCRKCNDQAPLPCLPWLAPDFLPGAKAAIDFRRRPVVRTHQAAEKLFLDLVDARSAEVTEQLHAMEPGPPGVQHLG